MSTARYLSLKEVGERIGTSNPAARGYHLPGPDALIGTTRGWLPETIDAWNAARPGRSSDAGNASPASSYSRARDTRSPTPWNAAAGNALSKTPDCPTSPSAAPATSSPRTSPKPEPRKTREKR